MRKDDCFLHEVKLLTGRRFSYLFGEARKLKGKAFSYSVSPRGKGEGALPIMGYTGRLSPKGVPL